MHFPRIVPARRRCLVALATAFAVLLLGAPAGEAIPPGGPVNRPNGAKVRISPLKVKKGRRIKVVGTNWKAKGSRLYKRPVVTVKLDDRDILAVIPIRRKRFSAYVTIPRPVRAGRHWLRFLAASPATSVRSRTFTVTR